MSLQILNSPALSFSQMQKHMQQNMHAYDIGAAGCLSLPILKENTPWTS